jgi:hypothetical protein
MHPVRLSVQMGSAVPLGGAQDCGDAGVMHVGVPASASPVLSVVPASAGGLASAPVSAVLASPPPAAPLLLLEHPIEAAAIATHSTRSRAPI